MKDLTDKYFVLVDKLILIVAFWSAIVVSLVTFTREAWVSNNMTEKSRNAILWFMGILDAFVDYVRQEMTPIEVAPVPVAEVSTKRTRRRSSVQE